MTTIQYYIINNPIGRLGNHIITYLNTIYLHYLLHNKNAIANNTTSHISHFKITLNNHNELLHKSVDFYKIHHTTNNTSHLQKQGNKNILQGYDIFHIQDILNKKLKSTYNICLYDYFNLASIYFPKLWNITTLQYNKFQSTFKSIIQNNYINLDKTLCIHIKCTDNTIPEKIIHKKYNIYPNAYYLDICNIYNYDTICICTDNPKHIIISNLIQHSEKRGINVINISTITNDMMMDFYFLACAKNILVDNSTFTFMSAIHPTFINEPGFSKDKTIFFYKDFFSRFLLDIGTTEWDKNILDFCINNLDSFQHTIHSNVLIYNEIEFSNNNQSQFCNCILKCENKITYNHTLVVFEDNINSEFISNNIKINIGEWVGCENQIQLLLLK
jgi:hypothetical protein